MHSKREWFEQKEYRKEGHQQEGLQEENPAPEGHPSPAQKMEEEKEAANKTARNEKLWAKAIKKYKKERANSTTNYHAHDSSLSKLLSIKQEMIHSEYRFYYHKSTGNEPPPPQAHHEQKPSRK